MINKLFIMALVLLISITFVSSGCARSKGSAEKSPPEKEVLQKAPSPEEPSMKPKTETSGFVGKVITVDVNVIRIENKKEAVSFDASNPELKGYKAIGEVKIGDMVAARYTKDGILITKLEGKSQEKKVEKSKKDLKKKVVVENKKRVKKEMETPTEEVVSRITCTGTGPCTITSAKLTKGKAVFFQDYVLKIVNTGKEGGSGTVYSTPTGIFCSTGISTGCEDLFRNGEEVTLSALADTGSTFIGWSPVSECPGTGDCIVPMNQKRTVSAVFAYSEK